MKDVGSLRCQKTLLGILTTGRLMGVTVISSAVGARVGNDETQLTQPPCAPPLPHHLHPLGWRRHGFFAICNA
jgi:hypothetical protein